uniref:Uncharacterized protein SB35P03.20 n=1 Tax=Sorghum bicolor TaxID=4558 RepID=Q8W0T9_SORBI|nr:putative protein NP_196765.1 [Sorghum bicolor]
MGTAHVEPRFGVTLRGGVGLTPGGRRAGGGESATLGRERSLGRYTSSQTKDSEAFRSKATQFFRASGSQEADQHLFFTCTVSNQVWSSANPPFLTNQIPEEDDGVQLSLSFFFQNDITDHDLCNKLFLLWYIWKARNDTRFQRKTWTANQIRLAAAARINAHLDALQNPNSLDISLFTNNTSAGTEQRSSQTSSDPFLVSFPSSFAGTRCYTDAATLPDNLNSDTSQAGLGVFIVNTDEHPPISIFVKALLQESSSVLMAESAALALATDLLKQIQCTRYTIFSNNQQLVNFLNQSDLSNPSDRRIKPYSQHAANLLAIFGTQHIKKSQKLTEVNNPSRLPSISPEFTDPDRPASQSKYRTEPGFVLDLAAAAAPSSQIKANMQKEIWSCSYAMETLASYAEDIDGGESPSISMLSEVAAAKKITIVGGSIPEKASGKMFNTCCVIGPDGKILAKHRKLHLFEIDIPGDITLKESDTFTGGQETTIVDTDVGRIGIGICHDIRFPELAMLYRSKGAHLICYPSAFNMSTGELLWDLMQKSRAVDNQFGEVLAAAGHEEATVIGEMDLTTIQSTRHAILRI